MIDIRHLIPSGYTGRFTIPDLSEVEGIAAHHSVSSGYWTDAIPETQEQEIEHLLAIDRWHSPPNNDFGGFGYHCAAFQSGRVYLCGSLNTARAHVAGLNHRFNGLVLIGDFSASVPTESHLGAAREGVAFIRAFHGRTLPVEAHRLIRGQNTTCPGEQYYRWVPGLNEAREEPMNAEDKAWVLRASIAAGEQKLVRGTGPDVYIVAPNGKRRFPVSGREGPGAFDDVGFRWRDVLVLPDDVLAAIPGVQ